MKPLFHDVEQNTDAWYQLRLGKVTGSNLPSIMANEGGRSFGEPAKRYALQLALERINKCKSETGFTNDHMERGKIQEPIARALYEQEYFVNVGNGGFFDCGEYGDSPDGLVDDDGVIEIKSVIAPIHYANLKRGSHDSSYTWQIVGHLDCTGRDWVDFISYCSDFPENKRIIVYRVMRKDYESHIERLRVRRNEFLKLIDNIVAELQEDRLTA